MALYERLQSCLDIMVKKVTVRRLESDDLETVLSWRNDPRVRSHMFNSNLITAAEHLAWFKSSARDSRRCQLLVLKQDIPFGFAQFHISHCKAVADWGFYVDPNGPKGQGQALGQSVLSFGFDELKLLRVTGQVLSHNTRSIALHKRMGFSYEGELRSHHFTKSVYQNVHLFGLLASEWKNDNAVMALTERISDKTGG